MATEIVEVVLNCEDVEQNDSNMGSGKKFGNSEDVVDSLANLQRAAKEKK